jgi:tetratricopeptide (TPR) repeat protein
MRNTGYILSFLIFFICAFSINSAQVENLMKQANTFYQDKNYEKAVETYKEILDKGYESYVLYYNLGNAYYKTGKLGYAILNYERALKLKPNDEDAQYNLKLANARTVDQIKEVPQIFLVDWWETLLASFSLNLWLVIAAAFYIVLLICIGLYFMNRKRRLQRFAFYFGTADFVILIITVILLIAKINRETSTHYGILLDSVQTAKISPDEKSSDAFVVHEGIKFEVEDKVDNWTKIKLADGTIGWLPDRSFGRI